ncbi:hypothetical protein JCM11251_003863 [Rhodosporidiobolus azoricus]
MPVLGGTTQHFRSYGKRRTNVINKRQPLGGWDASPDQVASTSSKRYECSSSSSSSDSDEEEQVRVVKPKAKPALAKKTVRRAATKRTNSLEVVDDVPAAPTSGGRLAPTMAMVEKRRQSRASAFDKENVAPPSTASVKKKPLALANKMQGRNPGKGKAAVINNTSTGREGEKPANEGKTIARTTKEQRTPLAAKSRPAPTTQGATADQKVKTVFMQQKTTTEEAEGGPPRRARVTGRKSEASKRKVSVIVSSDADDITEEEVAKVTSDVEIVEEPAAPIWLDELSSADEADESIVLVSRPPSPSRIAPHVKSSGRASSHSTAPSQRTIRTPPRFSSRPSYSASSASSPLSSLDTSLSSSFGTPRPAPTPSTHPTPSSLSPLLSSLLSPQVLSFSCLLTSPPPPFAYFSDPLARPEWRKIGEASYSEVFETMGEEGGEVVVKIIPIAPEAGLSEEEQENLPFMSEVGAVRREIEISRLLGAEGEGLDGFVRFKGAFVVQGSYPQELLDSWDEYKAAQSPSCVDQIRPDILPSTQLYALILLENAGSDLETYKLCTWREAASVWGQVVETIGKAEEEIGFEHRDLHWGNILLQTTTPSSPTLPSVTPKLNKRFSSLSLSYPAAYTRGTPPRRTLGGTGTTSVGAKLDLSPEASGIKATIIDFTLSRVKKEVNGEEVSVLFDAFEEDCVFEGEGDYQFDIYRSMRALVEAEGGGWADSHLKTNVLWLHYLATKLLQSKQLKPPTRLPSSASAAAYSAFASPARAASSPLRKPRRTASPIAGPTSFGSPAANSRRPRTLPSALSRHGSTQQPSRAELEIEYQAYKVLIQAEGALSKAIERWGLEVSPGRGRGRGKAKGPKQPASSGKVKRAGRRLTRSTVEIEEEEELERPEEEDFASAQDVGRWWKELSV